LHTATAAATNEKLGDILVREGLISPDQLKKALAEQKASGMRLGYTLVKLGFVEETEITKMLARQYRMPAVDLSRFEVDPKILKLIPGDIAEAFGPPAQAGRADADHRHRGPEQRHRDRRHQVHHPLRHLPGHRRRVHPPQRDRQVLSAV